MNISQEEWAKNYQQENAIIIDVRTADEFAEIRIPNAINIDIFKGQGFIYQIDELDKNKSYFVYCRSGARSENACNIMQQLGFEKAYNLVGGIIDWQGATE
jgi:rhodanese-related sulfurtransferase